MQDFIVQVNGGADATKALGQQLPQMLVGFGAAGAAIGVVAALLPNIVQAFSNTAGGAKTLGDAMSDFDKAIGAVGESVKQFDMDKVYEEFNKASGATRSAIVEQLKFQQAFIETSRLVAGKKFGESLSGMGEYGTLDKMAGAFSSSGAEKLAKQLGVGLETAKDLLPTLAGLKSGTEDVNGAFNRFGTVLLSGNAKAVKLATSMAELAKSDRDAASASSSISEAQEKMAKGHVQTKKEAAAAAKATKQLASEQQALSALLDTINGKSSAFDSSYVKNVELLLGAYGKGKLSLTEFNEVFARYVAMQPGAVAAAREQAKAQEDYAKALSAAAGPLESQAEKLENDVFYYGMAESAIQAVALARLEEARAIAEANGAYPEHLAFLDREIDARKRIASASAQKEFLDANKRAAESASKEWEKISDDIYRSLTDALFRASEAGGGFFNNLGKSLENALKVAIQRALIQTAITTGSNVLNSGINAVLGTSGNGGTNYLGLASNANSIYNLAGNAYALTGSAVGASSASLMYANAVGAMGGDSIGALYAANGGWAGVSAGAGTSAGAASGSSAGASASGLSSASVAWIAAIIMGMYMSGEAWQKGVRWDETYADNARGQWWYGLDSLAVNRDIMDAPLKALFGESFTNSKLYAVLSGSSLSASIHKAVQDMVFGGGGPKDESRYSTIAGRETSVGNNASYLQAFAENSARAINAMAELYGNATRVGGMEAWLATDPSGDAQTQLNLKLLDTHGELLYHRMDQYGGNIENVGRSSEAINSAMIDTIRDSLLMSVARADIGDKAIVSLFDQFETSIAKLSDERSDALVTAMGVGWLDDILLRVDEAKIGLDSVADAAANLLGLAPMKKVFDDLGVSLFDVGAQAEATLPSLAGLKQMIAGADGSQVMETFRETYLRTLDEFVVVANLIDTMGIKVSSAFNMGNMDNVLSMSDALVKLFGSVDNLKSSAASYFGNYHTKQEQADQAWKEMEHRFADIGVAMPKTREGFRDIVEDLIESGKIATESGQQIYKSLMDAQGAFASLTPELGSLTTAQAALEAQAKATAEALAAAAAAYASAADAALDGIYGRADSGLSALTQAIDLEKQRASAARDAAGEQVSAINSLFGLLDNQISGLYGNVESASAAMAEQGMAFIGQAVTAARSGYMPDQSQLSDAIGSVRAGLSGKSYGSNFERDFDALSLAGSLSQIRAAGEKQLPVAEQALNAAESQLKALDESLAWYSKQVDQLKGINSNTALLGGSIAEMGDSLVAELRAQMSALNAAVLAGVGSGMLSGPEAAQRLAAGGVAQDKITSVGSKPVFVSSKGAVATADQFTSANGWQGSLDDARKIIDQTFATASPEKFYTSAIQVGLSAAMIDALYGFPSGTANDWAKAHNLPSFANGGAYSGGLALVGENGPELINFAAAGHVYTAPQTATLLGGGDGAKLGRLVEALTAEVKRLQGQLAEVGANTRRTADAVNGNPESPMLVESV